MRRSKPRSPPTGSARRRRPCAGLLDVVNQAMPTGINLKIVLLDHNPPNDTPLRDIATVVGADHPDATVLALSPTSSAATARISPRARSRPAKTSPKRAIRWSRRSIFVSELETPAFSWTGHSRSVLAAAAAVRSCGRRCTSRAARSTRRAGGRLTTQIPLGRFGLANSRRLLRQIHACHRSVTLNARTELRFVTNISLAISVTYGANDARVVFGLLEEIRGSAPPSR